MTPMIDIVFQLLIYFLVTFETPDVLAHLDVFRPAPDSQEQKQDEPPKMINIEIYSNGITINGREVNNATLRRLLGKLASIDRSQTIVIKCAAESAHVDLIDILDACAENKLTNLSVVSTN